MRLLADENIDGPLVAWLPESGHDVLWIAEDAPSASDQYVLSEALLAGRILLTFDLDFGERVFRQAEPAAGVVLLRLRSASSEELYARFKAVWPRVEELATGRFIVVANDRIRVRSLPASTS